MAWTQGGLGRSRSKRIIAGVLPVGKGDGGVEEGSIPVTHGDIIGIHRDRKIQEQSKSRFESQQGSRLGGGRREMVGKQLKSFGIG